MADYGVTDVGFTIKPESVIIEELQNAMQAQFGADLDVDTESPEGQIIAVIADAANSLWQVAEHAYNAFNPNSATGVTLENLGLINNIEKQVATASTVTVTFTGSDGTVIPEGTTLSSDSALTGGTSYKFNTESEVTISGGSIDVLAIAEETGSIQVPVNSITTLDSPIVGVDSVTNNAVGNTGTDEETDPEFRARRESQVALPSVSTVDAILAGILEIDTVVSAKVYENDTATDTTEDGVTIPAHSIKLLVQGAETSEENALIANELFIRKDPGIRTSGTESYTLQDSQGFDKTFYWDTPTVVPFYIQIDTNAESGTSIAGDGSDIRDAIMEYIESASTGYTIGDDVSYARLFTPINSIAGHNVQSLTIGFDTGSMGTSDLNITGAQLASIVDPDNDIVVNITY